MGQEPEQIFRFTTVLQEPNKRASTALELGREFDLRVEVLAQGGQLCEGVDYFDRSPVEEGYTLIRVSSRERKELGPFWRKVDQTIASRPKNPESL